MLNDLASRDRKILREFTNTIYSKGVKTMKRFRFVFILAVLTVSLAAFNANAEMDKGMNGGKMGEMHHHGMNHDWQCEGMHHGHHFMHMLHKLGLDEKQSAEIKSIFSTMEKDRVKKDAEIKVAKIEVKEMLENDPVDMNMVEAKIKQAAELKVEAVMMHIKGMEDVKAKLTPEQRKKLTDMMHRGMEHMMWEKGKMECPMMKKGHKDAAGKSAPQKTQE